MVLMFQRELAIPLWAIALCTAALAWPTRLLPSFAALLGMVLITSTMMLMIRWFGAQPLTKAAALSTRRRPRAARVMMNVVAGTHVRPFDPRPDVLSERGNDALDLVRMDDDGGWRMVAEPSESHSTRRARTGNPEDSRT
jgi:hypothetical protein